jgi:hypothetical protein
MLRQQLIKLNKKVIETWQFEPIREGEKTFGTLKWAIAYNNYVWSITNYW